MRNLFIGAIALLTMTLQAVPLHADTSVLYSTSGGDASLQASALFSFDGASTLKVTLTNTSTVATANNVHVLSAVFFSTTQTLTPVSAALGAGSTFYWGTTTPTTTNLGGNYQYVGGSSDLVSAVGFNSGISAVGFSIAPGVFSQGNFGTPPENVDGAAYGLVSASTTSASYDPNSNLLPDIKNSVVFTLTTPDGFSLSELGSSVRFQWGTTLDDNHVVTPVPSSLVMLGTLVGPALGLLWYRRRNAVA